jgi:hypothetical protein
MKHASPEYADGSVGSPSLSAASQWAIVVFSMPIHLQSVRRDYSVENGVAAQ